MKKIYLSIFFIFLFPNYVYPLAIDVVVGIDINEEKITEKAKIITEDIIVAYPSLDDVKSLNPMGGGGDSVDFAGSKTELMETFFKSSELYTESLKLLMRAYDMDKEVQMLEDSLEYSKNSKNSEADRMKNSIKVTTEASDILKNSMDLKGGAISAEGKVMYAKALSPAIKGVISTIKLVPVSKKMVAGVSANPVSAFKEIGGLAKVIPQIPGYISTVTTTMGLILTGAKANNIEGADKLEASLGEL